MRIRTSFGIKPEILHLVESDWWWYAHRRPFWHTGVVVTIIAVQISLPFWTCITSIAVATAVFYWGNPVSLRIKLARGLKTP